jgi:hypothetical protein
VRLVLKQPCSFRATHLGRRGQDSGTLVLCVPHFGLRCGLDLGHSPGPLWPVRDIPRCPAVSLPNHYQERRVHFGGQSRFATLAHSKDNGDESLDLVTAHKFFYHSYFHLLNSCYSIVFEKVSAIPRISCSNPLFDRVTGPISNCCKGLFHARATTGR